MSSAEGTVRPADEIPLVLWAAVQHPDGSVRSRVRQAIAEWLSNAQPRYSREQIASFLRAQNGTAIEPFVLDEQDLELAGILVQYAFSEVGEQTRFRVVSRETLGTEGGVMLTNNLRGYYIERYAHGFRTKTPEDFGFVAPAEMPGPHDPPDHAQAIRAVCRFEETGLSITVSGVDWAAETGIPPEKLASQFQQHSHVLAPEIPFLQFGLRVEVDGDAVRIQTGSPESLLRVSAHLLQRSFLVLSARPEAPRTRAFIRLEPPEGEVLALPVTVTCTSRSMPAWVWLPGADGFPLSGDDRLAIARWFRPHDSWISAQLLEELT